MGFAEIQQRIEAWAPSFFRWVVRRNAAVVLVGLGLTLFFAAQLPGLRLDPDTEAYVPKGHPMRALWTEAKDRFGIGRDILVAVEATGPDGVFTPEILAGIGNLTEGIRSLPDVITTDVRSLTESDAVIGTAEGLDFEKFFDGPPADAEEARAIRAKVFDNPVYLDRLVSRDASIAAIVVRTHHTADVAHPTEIYRRIAEYAEAHPIAGTRTHVAGNPAVEYWYGRQMAADLARLIPLALLAVVTILFACFRTITIATLFARAFVIAALISATSLLRDGEIAWGAVGLASIGFSMLTVPGALLPAVVVGAAVIWTWGLQAMLGLPIYIAGTMVPPLLLANGCADGIHIMERYRINAATGTQPRDALIVATMMQLWRPVVVTSLTTAAGFGSLMIGRMTVYQVFGFTSAFGIIVALLMSLTVLPAALAFLPVPRAPQDTSNERLPGLLAGLGTWLVRRRWSVAGAGLAAVALLAGAASRLYVDYSWVESLQNGTPVLEADRVLRERHGGTMPLDIIVRAAAPDGIKDPTLLRAADAVLDELSAHPYVGDTRSLAEYIERMNQAMNEDRPDAAIVPDDRNLIAQYLLLYAMSGDPSELDDMVDYDYQAAHLAVLLRSDRMQILNDVVAKAEVALDRHVRPLGIHATVSGSAMIQKTVLDLVFTSQVYSLATAALLVFACLWLLFRSLTHALVCMLGPLFTAVANFGIMGAFGIPLGPDKAMVSAIALGIGIDYSIHLMARFRDALDEGLHVNDALAATMSTTGRAILFNAMVVVTGFAVLGASRSPSNAMFGWMIAGNMAIACVAALLLVPAALAILAHADALRTVAALEESAAGAPADSSDPWSGSGSNAHPL